jgi:hypothetical protein
MLMPTSTKLLSRNIINSGGPGEVFDYFTLFSYLDLFSHLFTVISRIIFAVCSVCNLLFLLFARPVARIFDG